MRPSILMPLCATVALATTGCQPPAPAPVDAPAETPTAEAPAGDIRWQCAEMIVTTRFSDDGAELRLPGTRLQLSQQVAASGAKYGDDAGNVFWSKGDAATLTLAGIGDSECERTERTSPWDAARERGVVLRATGNEPGWFAEVDGGEAPTLRAVLDFGSRTLEASPAQALPDGGYGGTAADGTAMELRIRDEPCRDDMSGHPFPASAKLAVGDDTFRGCAARLDD